MANKLFFRHALLPFGWAQNVTVNIISGLISDIEVNTLPDGATYDIALPGMVNLHSHSFQRAMAGLAEVRHASSDSFWTWRDLMYRFALQMSPDDIAVVATQAFVEMLEGGFCHVAEFHYLHHAPDGQEYDDIGEMAVRIAEAASITGIDLTLLPVFYAHAGFGRQVPALEQRRFVNSIASYERLYDRCAAVAAVGIAPHSLRAAMPDELLLLSELAGTKPVHIHIAEQIAEIEQCVALYGQRPVEYLLNHLPVDKNWCLIHATHTTAQERADISALNAVIGLCPVTEANLGDGIFPARDFSGAWGIGSDSNICIGVRDELRMLEYSQRLHFHQRNVMAGDITRATATALYQKAIEGGDQAVGRKGGFVVGEAANIVGLIGDDPDSALASWVFASRNSQVPHVWARGNKVVSDGRHMLAEINQSRFDAVVRRLNLGTP